MSWLGTLLTESKNALCYGLDSSWVHHADSAHRRKDPGKAFRDKSRHRLRSAL